MRRWNTWFDSQGQVYDEPGPGRNRGFTHKALNALAQGGNADLMKEAMVKAWEAGVFNVLGPALLTVHDELGLSVPRTREADEAFTELKYIMENVRKLSVPLVAEGGLGSSWGEIE
jgi:DNA polymerase-1